MGKVKKKERKKEKKPTSSVGLLVFLIIRLHENGCLVIGKDKKKVEIGVIS